MADLLALSARFIDDGTYEGPGSVNRVTTELSEVAGDVAVVEAFSHVVAFATDEGLVLFDTSLEVFADRILASLRGWSDRPVHTLVYTHGHVDHVGGARAFVDEAARRRAASPRVVAHAGVPARFARYLTTNGYNAAVNARQFGGARGLGPIASMGTGAERAFGPRSWVQPRTVFQDRMRFRAGDVEFELRHARGETDDHLWAWVPSHQAICAGDFVTWVFPNAGNPQKVQRYPLEWAKALREMAGLGAELLLPAHGLPVGGAGRIRTVLLDIAGALESIVEQCLSLMNEGERLDTLLHSVRLPDALLDKPYLRPVYDEPEFVVRNVWRLYGGWYDGNPAQLKPAPEAALARQVARLAGGVGALVSRARDLAEAGELRLACQIIEMATLAEPGDRQAHRARAEIYGARRRAELSLMARGIYAAAARESTAIAEAAAPD
jgi:alkyl sulfatase BDS1-like metallo-beta-lactamase superfamily hydrolase